MKHLLSFLIALAATATVSLLFVGTASAQQTTSTGTGTCTGTNPDGTAATWTMSGSITRTDQFGAHYDDSQGHFLGYLNINPYPAGASNCNWSVRTSSDIKPNCAGLSGRIFIHYTVYPGYGGSKTVASFIGAAYVTPNFEYNTLGAVYGFSTLSDVKDVQYKVTSLQGGSQTTWEGATTYL